MTLENVIVQRQESEYTLPITAKRVSVRLLEGKANRALPFFKKVFNKNAFMKNIKYVTVILQI